MPDYEFFCRDCKKTFLKTLTIARHDKEKIPVRTAAASNRQRAIFLPLCFASLGSQPPTQPEASADHPSRDLRPCPYCGAPMVIVERLTAGSGVRNSSNEAERVNPKSGLQTGERSILWCGLFS